MIRCGPPFLGHAQLVRGDKHGHALARTFFNTSSQPGVLRVQADHRLVNDKHLRVVQQRGHDGHALARAVREAFNRKIHELGR